MEEIWKPLKGLIECGEYYEISNLGNIRSIDNGNRKGKILSKIKDKNGYYTINLMFHGKRKNAKIHRLVALAFIPNPNNLPEINHKDECKTNNVFSNLEWCDRKYNAGYGTKNKKMQKKVDAFIYDTMEYIGTFESIKVASEILKVQETLVSKICRGLRKQTKGFTFKYHERV